MGKSFRSPAASAPGLAFVIPRPVFARSPRGLLAGMALVAWLAPPALPAMTFTVPDGESVVGEVRAVTAMRQDTLLALAEEFELGYEELVAANPRIDSWLPGEGSRVVLPSKFIVPGKIGEGIYINLAEYRLYYLPRKGTVITHPISIGRGDWNTPVGRTRVTHKLIKPTWYPPESILREHAEDGDPLPKVVPPGPDNPLGDYALKLDLPGYLIHGTNRPYGIGMKATHGCIRLRPANIAGLFEQTSVGTPVHIDWQPFKVGTRDRTIYLEAHPAGSEGERILGMKSHNREKERAAALTAAARELIGIADDTGIEIDWLRFAEVAHAGLGVPLPISMGNAAEIIRGAALVERRSTPSATRRAEAYIF